MEKVSIKLNETLGCTIDVLEMVELDIAELRQVQFD
jgi:hypothetical protein